LRTGIDKFFRSAILESSQKETRTSSRQIFFVTKEIPSEYREFFERDSQGMVDSQKEILAELLKEFPDVFVEQIVAVNCGVIQHDIKLTDCRLIKQAPRKILIGKRAEIEEIIRKKESL